MERVLSFQPEAQEWVELPLVNSRTYANRSYRCVSWSGSNLIAFSCLEGIYFSKGVLSYPIHVIPPNIPHEFHTIFTPHTSTIKVLEWAPPSFGNYLLSADETQVCIWQQLESLSSWRSLDTFAFDLPLAVHWIGSDEQKFSHGRTDNEVVAVAVTGFELSRAPSEVRTTSIVAVSASGAVAVWTQRPFESHWSVMRAELSGELVLTAVAVCYRRGGVVVAAAGPSFGNIVSLYEVTLEFDKQSISVHLTARITLPGAGVPSHLQLIVPPSGLLRLLATRAQTTGNGSCEVWDEHLAASVTAPVSASPLQVVNPADDTPSHVVTWKRVCAVPIESSFSLVQFLGHKYIIIALEDGRTEYRHSESGTLVEGLTTKSDVMRTDSDVRSSTGGALTGGSKRFKAAGVQRSPVALCLSPNRYCAAILYRSGAISVFHLSAFADREDDPPVRLANQLERAMFLGYDYWDVLVVLYAKSLDDPASAPIQRLMLDLHSDLNALPPALAKLRSHLGVSLDSLKAILFRSIAGAEGVAADAHARVGLRLAHDVTRSLLTKPSQLPSEVLQEGIAELENLWKPSNPPAQYVDSDQLQPLFLLTEWVLDLAALLIRNTHQYAQTNAPLPALNIDPLLEAVPEGYLSIAALQGLQLPLLIPLLLDVEMLKMLREMLVLAHLIREQLVARRLVTPIESTYVPQTIRSLQEVVHRMIVTCKQQPADGAGVFANLFAIASGAEKAINTSLLEGLKGTGTLTESLRLLPAQGTLFSQLVIDPTGSQPPPKHRFVYSSGDSGRDGRADVLTRAAFMKEERRGSVRQCVRCGSFSAGSDSREKEAAWLRRWDAACPVCGGVWLTRSHAKPT